MKNEKFPDISAAGIVMLQKHVVPVVPFVVNRILFRTWLKEKSEVLELLRVTTMYVFDPMVTLKVFSSNDVSRSIVSP